MKKKRNKYLFFNIIVPIIFLILLFIFFNTLHFKFVDQIIIEGVFQFEPSSFLIKNVKLLASICIVFIIISRIRKRNKEKEFLPTEFYGNIPYFIYYIANKVLGYKKINLQNKPYYIQFKIVLHNFYDITRNDESYPSKDLKYQIIEYPGDKISMDSYNLIVADTYPINLEQIPTDRRNNSSILIKRKNEEHGRYYSDNLISIIEEKILKFKENNMPVNIFLCTNPKTTQIMIEKIFKTGGRDGFILRIYQQNLTNNRCFEKYKTIKF